MFWNNKNKIVEVVEHKNVSIEDFNELTDRVSRLSTSIIKLCNCEKSDSVYKFTGLSELPHNKNGEMRNNGDLIFSLFQRKCNTCHKITFVTRKEYAEHELNEAQKFHDAYVELNKECE